MKNLGIVFEWLSQVALGVVGVILCIPSLLVSLVCHWLICNTLIYLWLLLTPSAVHRICALLLTVTYVVLAATQWVDWKQHAHARIISWAAFAGAVVAWTPWHLGGQLPSQVAAGVLAEIGATFFLYINLRFILQRRLATRALAGRKASGAFQGEPA